ncbi:MAG: DUF6134 family protein [Paracoccaceae bacterium]
MVFSRRDFLKTGGAASAAALCSPSAIWAATSARRDFVIKIGRREIGASSVNLRRQGSSIIADVSAQLDISILGLLNFTYDLRARETWHNSRLQNLEATTNNDGTADFANAAATSGGVQVNGSRYSGLVPGNPATTSFFAADFLTRPVWISTQDGRPLNIRAGNAGPMTLDTGAGPANVTRYAVRGGMEIDLFYTDRGEWVGSQRTLAGQRVSFLATPGTGSLMSVWLG